MSIELKKIIDDESLILDCERLCEFKRLETKCEDIDNLVCDTIDELAKSGYIKYRETVDVAYYIANEIKKKFII